MSKVFLVVILLVSFFSCNYVYKAGNRYPDINQRYDVGISPYYIKKYMKKLDFFYANNMVMTSEMVNFPDNFIPVTDSLNGYKFVIEFHSLDSLSYVKEHYLALASLYDFKKRKWIKDRDSLNNGELEKFKMFFKDSVMNKVVQEYKGKVVDTILFVKNTHLIDILELQ